MATDFLGRPAKCRYCATQFPEVHSFCGWEERTDTERSVANADMVYDRSLTPIDGYQFLFIELLLELVAT
jgi:hypothetical protein